MGIIVDNKAFINSNIFNHERRIESQYTIFLDKTPTFVTYYHINNTNSIVDVGFLNVERILGEDSPVRFQRIEDFPIYGLDSIKLDLVDDDFGLTSSYEGDAIILPNTIKPLPNDCFKISYLDQNYLFMINSIDYDTIKSNNFYKITFGIKALNPGDSQKIDLQVLESYTCIFENIGTDDKCLIKSEEYEKFYALEDIYGGLIDKYIKLFYDKRYNSMLFKTSCNSKLYDRYLTHFIDKHRLLNQKDDYATIKLSNEDYTDTFILEYEYSFYTLLEHRNVEDLDYVKYINTMIAYPESIFKFYSDLSVRSVLLNPLSDLSYIPDTLIDNIKKNVITSDMNILEKILIGYFNKNIQSIYEIDIDLLKRYKLEYTFNDFLMIPISLFIIRNFAIEFMNKEDPNEVVLL